MDLYCETDVLLNTIDAIPEVKEEADDFDAAENMESLEIEAIESYPNALHVEFLDEEEEEEENLSRNETSNYRDREEALKQIYYQSNPLRNFVASTKGQSILPPSKMSSNVYSNKKKSLPQIFSDLRIADREHVQEDRDLHKKKMRTTLKLNLKALEMEKNPIDSLEASKKIYSEYCRHNLSRPIDLRNVESILKYDLKQFKNRSQKMKKILNPNQPIGHSNGISLSQPLNTSNNSSMSSDESTFRSGMMKPLKKLTDELEINAQTVKLKDLNGMGQEIKRHKTNLAKSNIYNAIYLNCDEEAMQSNKTNSIQNNSKHVGKSVLNKHLAAKEADSDVESDENKMHLNRHQSIDTQYSSNLVHQSILNIPPPLVEPPLAKLNEDSSVFAAPNVYYSEVSTADERHKIRVQHARDKVLNETNDKANLNKMTILQPFEDTKILINIDNVSSKILNNLLNKQNTVPRYYMPPIRSFGYFKKVTTSLQDNLDRIVSGKRPSAKARQKFNF